MLNQQPVMTAEEYQLLDEFLSTRFGLTFPEHKKEILESRLRGRLNALKLKHFMDYYLLLQFNPNGTAELRHLIEAITNNETYFFRETHQIQALFDTGITELKQKSAFPDKIRILCAGCSSGEEAYTLNIFAKEMQFSSRLSVEIDAFDLDTTRLNIARKAEYGSVSMRGLSAEQKSKYFRQLNGERYQLKDAYREGVKFSEGNLLELETYKKSV